MQDPAWGSPSPRGMRMSPWEEGRDGTTLGWRAESSDRREGSWVCNPKFPLRSPQDQPFPTKSPDQSGVCHPCPSPPPKVETQGWGRGWTVPAPCPHPVCSVGMKGGDTSARTAVLCLCVSPRFRRELGPSAGKEKSRYGPRCSPGSPPGDKGHAQPQGQWGLQVSTP